MKNKLSGCEQSPRWFMVYGLSFSLGFLAELDILITV